MLPVHKVHLLCGKVKSIDLLNYTKQITNEKMIKTEKKSEFINKTYNHKNVDHLIQEVKRILNYFIDENYKNEIIDMVGKKFKIDFNSGSYYLTAEEIKEMSKNRMVIGSHTSSHPVMSKLSRNAQNNEIDSSFKFIDTLLTQDLKTYCHPYGGMHTFNIKTIEALKSHNVDFSFNVEPRSITEMDLKNSIHFLPRFDCNRFKFGQVD